MCGDFSLLIKWYTVWKCVVLFGSFTSMYSSLWFFQILCVGHLSYMLFVNMSSIINHLNSSNFILFFYLLHFILFPFYFTSHICPPHKEMLAKWYDRFSFFFLRFLFQIIPFKVLIAIFDYLNIYYASIFWFTDLSMLYFLCCLQLYYFILSCTHVFSLT